MGPVSECSGFQAIIWIPGQNLDIFFRLNHMIKVLVSRLYGGLNTGPIFKCACYLKSGDLNNGQAYYWCSLFRSPLYLTKNVLYSKLYLYRAFTCFLAVEFLYICNERTILILFTFFSEPQSCFPGKDQRFQSLACRLGPPERYRLGPPGHGPVVYGKD